MAGRPRTPTNILKLNGSAKRHPERMKERENEPVNTQPIGEPPEFLTDVEKSAFNEIVNISITGVLGQADRISVERAAVLLCKCRGLSDAPASYSEQAQLYKYLGQFGMLPADRSKISIPKKKKVNSFDDD